MSYILCPRGLKVGQEVHASREAQVDIQVMMSLMCAPHMMILLCVCNKRALASMYVCIPIRTSMYPSMHTYFYVCLEVRAPNFKRYRAGVYELFSSQIFLSRSFLSMYGDYAGRQRNAAAAYSCRNYSTQHRDVAWAGRFILPFGRHISTGIYLSVGSLLKLRVSFTSFCLVFWLVSVESSKLLKAVFWKFSGLCVGEAKWWQERLSGP
jgi:hypothetical protein